MIGLGLGIPLHYRRLGGLGRNNPLFSGVLPLLDGYEYDKKCLNAALDTIHKPGNDLPQIYFDYLRDFVVSRGWGIDYDCLFESFRTILGINEDSLPNEVPQTIDQLMALSYDFELSCVRDLALKMDGGVINVQEPPYYDAQIANVKSQLDALGFEYDFIDNQPTIELAFKGYEWDGFCLPELLEKMGDVDELTCLEELVLKFEK